MTAWSSILRRAGIRCVCLRCRRCSVPGSKVWQSQRAKVNAARHVATMAGVAEPDREDRVLTRLRQRADRFAGARQRLHRKRFHPVLQAERLPIEETVRVIEQLGETHIRSVRCIVNRLWPADRTVRLSPNGWLSRTSTWLRSARVLRSSVWKSPRVPAISSAENSWNSSPHSCRSRTSRRCDRPASRASGWRTGGIAASLAR